MSVDKFPKPITVRIATKDGRIETTSILFNFKLYKLWKERK